jgi:capsular polysaccharide export protein
VVTLLELVFTTLVQYPLYIDWDTGLWVTPELLIDKIADGKNQDIKKQSFWNRKLLKLQYIFEIFRSAH